METRSRELAELDLVAVLSSESGRRFLTHLVYDVCGVTMLRYDHAVKDGIAADGRGAFLDGMAAIGLQIQTSALHHATTLWCRAERERIARIEMALTTKPQRTGDQDNG